MKCIEAVENIWQNHEAHKNRPFISSFFSSILRPLSGCLNRRFFFVDHSKEVLCSILLNNWSLSKWTIHNGTNSTIALSSLKFVLEWKEIVANKRHLIAIQFIETQNNDSWFVYCGQVILIFCHPSWLLSIFQRIATWGLTNSAHLAQKNKCDCDAWRNRLWRARGGRRLRTWL